VKDSTGAITVSILGKDFMVACPENEREDLLAAANYLDKKMREIHASGKVIGIERAAVMAALNIANELLELRSQKKLPPDISDKIKFLQNKIDAVLNH
jgi:cell division protein ZapA